MQAISKAYIYIGVLR